MQTSYFGRLPEQGKLSLKAQVSQEAFHWLGRKEDLTVVAIADGARDNWAFLDTFSPDVVLLDYFQHAEFPTMPSIVLNPLIPFTSSPGFSA